MSIDKDDEYLCMVEADYQRVCGELRQLRRAHDRLQQELTQTQNYLQERVHELCQRAEAAEARWQALKVAASSLANEASGLLGLEREAITALVSVTNVRCLERRIAETRAVLLAALDPSLAPKEPK